MGKWSLHSMLHTTMLFEISCCTTNESAQLRPAATVLEVLLLLLLASST